MNMAMNDDNVVSIAQLREFLKLSSSAKFNSVSSEEAYEWIGRTLGKFGYFKLAKKEKGIVRAYIRMMAGYSDTIVSSGERKRSAGS